VKILKSLLLIYYRKKWNLTLQGATILKLLANKLCLLQVPPESILLPISTHLKHFLNKRQPKLQVWNLQYCKTQQDIRLPAYATGISNALRFEHKKRRLRSGYETNEKATQYQGRKTT
jgi:hypothetical protein